MEQIRAGVKADSGRLRARPLWPRHRLSRAQAAIRFGRFGRRRSDIKFDIRYASSNNFIGFPLYERPAAYLQRPAAEALGRVERALASKGYGLLIHDGYRPWFVTKMFWDATPHQPMFLWPIHRKDHGITAAAPWTLTLYDLKSGSAVEMPGGYDEMSPRSYADYVGGTSRQRWLRLLLRSEMEAQGFAVYPEEWWHFDYKDWGNYGIGTATFAQLRAAS